MRTRRPAARARVLRAALLALAAAALGPAARAEEVKAHVYKKTPQGELRIHVHLPPDWKADDRRPAIVFFFGGGWTGGTVEQFLPQAGYLAKRGMVAARADYRVKSRHQVAPDACVEDAKSAVRWLRQHAAELGVDPGRIAAAGGSAGGHIAACTAVTGGLEAEGEDTAVSSRPNLLVLFNPALLEAGFFAERGSPPDRAKSIDVVANLAKDAPPAILFYGTQDDKFIPGGRSYAAKAKSLGAEAELYTAERVGHGFFNRAPWQDSTLRQADLFLARHGFLKGDPAIPADPGATLKTVEGPAPDAGTRNP
jgi:acetyl esterase/lipase